MALGERRHTLYVAAFGSSAVGVFDAAALEDDSFAPGAERRTSRSAAAARAAWCSTRRDGRLYVLTRFDNAVKVVDLADARRDRRTMRCTTRSRPRSSTGGTFLYDARFTSSNGEASCASCHIFGDFDSLAWDLGNPDDVVPVEPQSASARSAATRTSIR